MSTSKIIPTNKNQEIVVTCKKCKKQVSSKNTLLCANCKHRFEFDCAGFSEKLYRIMKPTARKIWKCNDCTRKLSELLPPTNKTPSFVTTRKNKPVTISAPKNDEVISSTPNLNKNTESSSLLRTQIEDTHSMISTKDNCSPEKNVDVTQVEKYAINISTQNSFEKLSDEDDSSTPLTSLTSTPAGDTNRSFPELRSNNSYKMEHLKEKLARLELNLHIAENEIENLLSENQNLKKQLNEQELKINQLTHICRQTPNTNSAKKKPRRLVTIATESSLENKDKVRPKSILRQEHDKMTAPSSMIISDEPVLPLAPNTLTEGSNDFIEPQILPKGISKNIYILGDENLKGLSAALVKSRYGKWNDTYKTFAFIKNDASSTDIITYCDVLQNDLTKDDIVVLGLGCHDNDIHVLHSNLCIAISKLNKASVLLVPVHQNRHFNERTLNHNLKLWTKHFDFCKFIDITGLFLSKSDYLKYVCNKINICIDYKQYESQFLNRTSIKNYIRLSLLHKYDSEKNHVDKKKCEIRPGTIPYYFQKSLPPKSNLIEQTRKAPDQVSLITPNTKCFFRP